MIEQFKFLDGLFSLRDKVALVTGSSKGLGFAIARGLARAGATVVVNSRHPEQAGAASAQLVAEGLSAISDAFDVTDSAAVRQAIGRIEQEVGALDILVNNAGINRRVALEEYEERDWRALIETNLTAAFLVGQAVGRRMIERRRGKIINICSISSEVSRPNVGAYSATKGGLKLLTKGMATDWAKYGIQVNGIGPGFFLTELTSSVAANPQIDAWVKARTPAGRWGDPDDLVGAAVFLSSAASSFMTGQVVYVDGGILATM